MYYCTDSTLSSAWSKMGINHRPRPSKHRAADAAVLIADRAAAAVNATGGGGVTTGGGSL